MFNLEPLIEKIADKLKPVLEQGRKQAELNMLVQTITNVYSANLMRGSHETVANCVLVALRIIAESEQVVEKKYK